MFISVIAWKFHEGRGNKYCQDSSNFDSRLRLCHSNQRHLSKVSPGLLYSLLLWNGVSKPFVIWSSGFAFKFEAISYSGRQPPAWQIHSPKKYEFRWIKPLVSHFSGKPTQYIKAVNLCAIDLSSSDFYQERAILAGSHLAVHALPLIIRTLPRSATSPN